MAKYYNKFAGYEKEVVKVPTLNMSSDERADKIGLMREIFEVQSTSYDCDRMADFLIKYISDLNDENITVAEDRHGNIYVTKGEAETYPCIVSHIDTVHDIIPDESYMVLNNGTEFFALNTASRMPTGIGGDDKNGIFCCLDALNAREVVKLAFFVDEEVGCVGSSYCDMSFFDNVAFALQADRKGYKDVVSEIMGTNMFDEEFLLLIQSSLVCYEREITDGGMTDVMQLNHNGLNISMANFSCGYYEPHSDFEYTVIDELILTSELMKDICSSAWQDGVINTIPEQVHTRYKSAYKYNGYGQEGSENDGFDKPNVDTGYTFDDEPKDIRENTSMSDYCSYCGQQTVYDESVQLNYCHNCQDYDLNTPPF